MPYVKVGNCVHKQNADGSAGEQLHCYDGEGASEKADRYMRALYANVKTSDVQELSMTIVKASLDKATQEMRWRAVASDTSKDLYHESMSLELFSDFVHRINEETPVPEPFNSVICEGDWCGGIPYLSVSHYKSGTKRKNVPGEIKSVYIDGNRLKGTGTLNNTPMGKKVFDEMCKDLYAKRSQDDTHLPIRISIGFLDLEHKHVGNSSEFVFTRSNLNQICPLCSAGIGDKIYTKGQLVHWALTRVPVNPRTAMEVDKSMDIHTRKDDAESIIGKDMANELEEDALTTKSDVTEDNMIVIKTDIPESNQLEDAKNIGSLPEDMVQEIDKCYDGNFGNYDQECIDKLINGHRAGNTQKLVGQEADKISYDKVVKSEEMQDETLEEESAVTKHERGCDNPSSHYLVVGDPKKVTTWHLPVKGCDGKLDTHLMGAAKAALTSNYRGHSYSGEDKEAALEKLKRYYSSMKMDFEAKSLEEEDMSQVNRGNTSEAKKLIKAPVDVKDRFDDEDILEEPTDENPSDVSAEGKVPTNPKGKKAIKANSKASAKNDYDAAEDENDPEDKKDTKADEAFDKMKKKMLYLKSQGISGAEALKIIQPDFVNVGKAIEEDMSGASPVESALLNELSLLRREMAEMKAAISGKVVADKSDVPGSRAISLKSNTMKPEDLMLKSQPFQPTSKNEGTTSQIKALARKSTGLQ